MNAFGDINKVTPSLQDYLKAIVILKGQGQRATITVLSRLMGVKKPSVDWAIKKLANDNLVIHERYGDVDLTPKGTLLAEEVYRRHKALFTFLTNILKVNVETAARDACRMEHSLSRESINRLEEYIDFALNYDSEKAYMEDIFSRFIEHDKGNRKITAGITKSN
jgi:DtxR family Mn-dependent transcriptional regulator